MNGCKGWCRLIAIGSFKTIKDDGDCSIQGVGWKGLTDSRKGLPTKQQVVSKRTGDSFVNLSRKHDYAKD